MAPSNFWSGRDTTALQREQRALFKRAAAKHKIRVAEEPKLNPLDGQLGATGDVISEGGPVVDALTEKAAQKPVKRAVQQKAKASTKTKAAKKSKAPKNATSETLTGGSGELGRLFPGTGNSINTLTTSAFAPASPANHHPDSFGVSNSSPISYPAQAGVQTSPLNSADNLQDLLSSWGVPPISDSDLLLSDTDMSNSPTSDSMDWLSGLFPPDNNFPPSQVPGDSVQFATGATVEDIFGMPVENGSNSVTTAATDHSFNSKDSLFGDDSDDDEGDGNSFNSITSLFGDDGDNGAAHGDGIPISYSDLLEGPNVLGIMAPGSPSPGNASYPSLPDLNIAQGGNAQEPLLGFPEEGCDLDMVDSVCSHDSDDYDDSDSADETPIPYQPMGQGSGENQSMAEAAPNASHPQQFQTPLESGQNHYDLVEAQLEGARYISGIAQPETRLIGTNADHFCYRCLHPGHKTNASACPVGRVESLMDPDKETFYTLLDAVDIRQKLLLRDIGWIAEGLNWGIDMAQEGVLDGLGILPSSLVYLSDLLVSWTSVSENQAYTFGPIPGFSVVCGEEVEIDETQQNTAGLYKVTKSHNIKEVTFASLLQGSSAPPTSRKRKRAPEQTVAQLLNLDSIGARPKATCSRCLYPGHTFNSTLLCPFSRIKSAVDKSKTQKSWRIVDLDDDVAKLRKVIDGLGESDERTAILVDILERWEHVSRGAGPSKSKKSRAGSGTNSKAPEDLLPVNTTSNGKRRVGSQPSGTQSPTSTSSGVSNGFGAPGNIGIGSSTFPGESSSSATPGYGTPGSSHSSNTSVGDLQLDVPECLRPSRRTGIKTIGARPDTICKQCFYTGHDQRSQACPANILRRALFQGSLKDLQDAGNSCQDISDILAWEASQPTNMKANSALRQKLETLHTKFTTALNLLSPPQVGKTSQEEYASSNRNQVFSTPRKCSYQEASFQEQSTSPASSPYQTRHSQEQLGSPIRFEQAPLSGICIDHSKLDSKMLMDLLPFVIKGQETRGLRVDHAKMSPQLIMVIAPFIIPDAPIQSSALQDHSYQAGQHKESRKLSEQSSSYGGSPSVTNSLRNDFPVQSQFPSSPPAFCNSSGTMAKTGNGNQYNNNFMAGSSQRAQYQPGAKRRRGN
ncbi:unnamed protein product [Tuber aestivum]|uniref:Uncharacterized protein n=1 Tax=Tuber aestivum TaxID=59557 RepID=A0A292Q2X1_9PEZI|nr:unnamed protein product [Tuber aestivum]